MVVGIYIFVLIAMEFINLNILNGQLVREKRGIPLLTFPRTSPTRVQIISGIGIPVALDFESVTIGYVFKAEYFLPENASNVLDIIADPFNPTTRPITGTGRRKRQLEEIGKTGYDYLQNQKFEQYSVEAVVVEEGSNSEPISDDINEELFDDYGPAIANDPDINNEKKNDYTLSDIKIKESNNLGTARFTLYKGIENLLSKKGMQGRPCMLRSICEAAAAQFSYNNGILGELAHIIMSPSTSPDQVNQHSDHEYQHAEQLGKNGEPCDKIFHECPISIIDKFSGMYNTLDGLINMFT